MRRRHIPRGTRAQPLESNPGSDVQSENSCAFSSKVIQLFFVRYQGCCHRWRGLAAEIYGPCDHCEKPRAGVLVAATRESSSTDCLQKINLEGAWCYLLQMKGDSLQMFVKDDASLSSQSFSTVIAGGYPLGARVSLRR